MKLWLLNQITNNNYNTYDSCVVTAETEEDARCIHPSEGNYWGKEVMSWWCGSYRHTDNNGWVKPNEVKVTYLGETPLGGGVVVCSSFNAG